MRIYTVTLNPAYDIHAKAAKLELLHENLAHVISREAGGKGINISRALTVNNVSNTAIAVLGKENAADFKNALSAWGMNCILFEKEGRIRENLTLHARDGETRISFAGFSLDGSILDEILRAIDVDENTVVTFTGRVPDGIDMGDVKKFLSVLRQRGAKIVVDSRSFSLEDILEVKPWLIKPNEEEISMYFGCDINDLHTAARMARAFVSGGVENVSVSLGAAGAVLLREDGAYIARPPKIDALSTIGAGDSSVAGFIAAFAEGASPMECLRRGVAFGSAACLTEGTLPPKAEDVQTLLPLVTAEKINL